MKKSNKPLVSCRFCIHSELYEDGNDPMIAYCTLHDSREVANQKRLCDDHILELDKEIRQLK